MNYTERYTDFSSGAALFRYIFSYKITLGIITTRNDDTDARDLEAAS